MKVSMGNHHFKTSRHPSNSKIRKILMPIKSSEKKFTHIGVLSFQFSMVYTVTLKLLNTTVIEDSCLPRRVN